MNLSNGDLGIDTYKNLDEVAQTVAAHDGLVTLRMSQLRDAHGAGRLGVHVRAGISAELSARGIGHYPEELPADQIDDVRLFKLGSPIAALIQSVMTLGPEEDEKLRQFAGGDAPKILARVRELVCS